MSRRRGCVGGEDVTAERMCVRGENVSAEAEASANLPTFHPFVRYEPQRSPFPHQVRQVVQAVVVLPPQRPWPEASLLNGKAWQLLGDNSIVNIHRPHLQSAPEAHGKRPQHRQAFEQLLQLLCHPEVVVRAAQGLQKLRTSASEPPLPGLLQIGIAHHQPRIQVLNESPNGRSVKGVCVALLHPLCRWVGRELPDPEPPQDGVERAVHCVLHSGFVGEASKQ
eukprot:3545062-Prymnesium_polylepis.1